MKKSAIVTGASGGIGSAIAIQLAKEGYDLFLFGNQSSDKLQQVVEKCKALGVTVTSFLVDAKKENEVEAALKGILNDSHAPSLLVNCAGISYIGLLSDMTDLEWRNVLDSNLSSMFYFCRTVIPSMVHEKKGRIINISSVWGEQGASCEVAYSATKGAMNSFTKALAKELAPSNIAVNAIACGLIDTPMNSCFSQEELDAICEDIPIGRMGTPDEVAELVALVAKAPMYMTGQVITISGGWS